MQVQQQLRFVEVSCPVCGQPTVVDREYENHTCDWVDDAKSRREGAVCGETFTLDEVESLQPPRHE